MRLILRKLEGLEARVSPLSRGYGLTRKTQSIAYPHPPHSRPESHLLPRWLQFTTTTADGTSALLRANNISSDSRDFDVPDFEGETTALPSHASAAQYYQDVPDHVPQGWINPEAVRYDDMDNRPSDHSFLSQYADVTIMADSALQRQRQDQSTIEDVLAALQKQDPQALMKSMLGLLMSEKTESLREIPATSFNEILRTLDPEYFVDRYMNLHREISWKHTMYRELPHSSDALAYPFAEIFKRGIMKIMQARRAAGFRLALFDYTYLLRCMRALGDVRGAEALWAAMEQDGITPDTICYNHFMATLVWSDILNPFQRNGVRVIPQRLAIRRWEKLPAGFDGHRVGPESGIQKSFMTRFNEMIQAGVVADEETYSLLIVAFARENNTAEIEELLKRVWGIEKVWDSRSKQPKWEITSGQLFTVSSALRPSKELLLALAHAYGINNRVWAGFRLVESISKHYGVAIPIRVWEELVERAYVLSRYRSRKDRDAGLGKGKRSPRLIYGLLRLMTSDEHNVRPSMFIYNKVINALIKEDKVVEAQDLMMDAYKIHKESLNAYSRLKWILKASPEVPNSDLHEKMHRDIAYLQLRMRRNRYYFRSWCQRVMNELPRIYKRPIWIFLGLPKFLLRWKNFFPSKVSYQTPSGYIDLYLDVRDVEEDFEPSTSMATLDDLLEEDE